MPEKLERELKTRARKMGLGKERTGAYVFGTMRKTGWKPSRGHRKDVARIQPIDLSSHTDPIAKKALKSIYH